jgi:hypothetical protein
VKDNGWKETAGEVDAIGLFINKVSGKPFSLFLLQLPMEGNSFIVVYQVRLPYVRDIINFLSSQTTKCCAVRYMYGRVILFCHEVFHTGIIS